MASSKRSPATMLMREPTGLAAKVSLATSVTDGNSKSVPSNCGKRSRIGTRYSPTPPPRSSTFRWRVKSYFSGRAWAGLNGSDAFGEDSLLLRAEVHFAPHTTICAKGFFQILPLWVADMIPEAQEG